MKNIPGRIFCLGTKAAYFGKDGELVVSNTTFKNFFPDVSNVNTILCDVKSMRKGACTSQDYESVNICSCYFHNMRMISIPVFKGDSFSGRILLLFESPEENNRQMEQFVEMIPLMTFIGDATSVKYVNKKFLDFCGCKNVREFQLKCDDKLYNLFALRKGYLQPKQEWLQEALHLKKFHQSVKVQMFQKGGARKSFLIEINELQGQNSHIITFTDITALDSEKNVIEEANSIQDMSEEDSISFVHKQELMIHQSKLEIMEEIISLIAHQLKQPLNIVGLYAQNLQEDVDYGTFKTEEISSYTSNIMKNVQYMADVVDYFREFFRPYKEPLLFDVEGAISGVSILLEPILERSMVKLSFEPHHNSIYASGYPSEFRQVLVILVINSKDAIEEHQATTKENFEGKINIDLQKDSEYVTLTLSDNGGGIKDEVFDKIFAPYVTTKGTKGSGIGLTLARLMIESMDGEIKASNHENGAKFVIKLRSSL